MHTEVTSGTNQSYIVSCAAEAADLEHLRRLIERHNPQAILLGEVDVDVEQYPNYFGDNNRLNMVLNFG